MTVLVTLFNSLSLRPSTALHAAITKESLPTEIAGLIRRDEIDEKVGGKTALHVAVAANNVAVTALLVSCGANPNSVDDITKDTCFHKACAHDSTELVEALGTYPHEIKIDARNGSGNSALYLACSEGHEKTARALCRLGASLDLANAGDAGMLPIHIVAKKGHTALLSLFCERPDLVNARLTKILPEATPFHFACDKGMLATARKLVEMGAQLDAKIAVQDNPQATALYFAAYHGYSGLIELFKEMPDILHCERVQDIARKNGHASFLSELFKYGVTPLFHNGPGEVTNVYKTTYEAKIDELLKTFDKKSLDQYKTLVKYIKEYFLAISHLGKIEKPYSEILEDVFSMQSKRINRSIEIVTRSDLETPKEDLRFIVETLSFQYLLVSSLKSTHNDKVQKLNVRIIYLCEPLNRILKQLLAFGKDEDIIRHLMQVKQLYDELFAFKLRDYYIARLDKQISKFSTA